MGHGKLFIFAVAVFVIASLTGSANGSGPPHVACAHRIHLSRFEDGSARLYCGQRTLTIVEVPG